MFMNAVVRNATEDFHAEHLSDAQMRELNPIIRNAVYTALHAVHSMLQSQLASRWVMFQMMYIPSYWEQPELLEAHVNSIDPKNQWLGALLRENWRRR
jgi:protoheme ferro-lyase